MGHSNYIPFFKRPNFLSKQRDQEPPPQPKPRPDFRLCSECFKDVGLKLEARRIGTQYDYSCPNCKLSNGYALNDDQLRELQTQFFSRATAPNQYRQEVAVLGVGTDPPDHPIELRPETLTDWSLIRRAVGGRLWFRSPRLFYLGITNHFGLHASLPKDVVRNQIVPKLRFTEIDTSTTIYRIRLDLNDHTKFDEEQYDTPPNPKRRNFFRFDNRKLPIFYGSPNLQVCIHECRVTLLNDIFVASFTPTKTLSLIDLTDNYNQPKDIDPFDNLEWFFIGLMNSAQPKAYRHCRRIAQTIRDITKADGFVYNSYYTNAAGDSEGKTVNYALFGRPLSEGKLEVKSINTVRLERIQYAYHLGPLFRWPISLRN